MNEETLLYYKEKLLKLKDELLATIAILKEKAKPVAPDVSLGRLTRQEAMQEQNIAKENLRHMELQLKKTQGALHRIQTKTFGECVDCGDDIAQGRLEIMPENGLCIVCATEHQ